MSLRGFSALISALAQLNIDLLKQDIIVMFQTIQQVFCQHEWHHHLSTLYKPQ